MTEPTNGVPEDIKNAGLQEPAHSTWKRWQCRTTTREHNQLIAKICGHFKEAFQCMEEFEQLPAVPPPNHQGDDDEFELDDEHDRALHIFAAIRLLSETQLDMVEDEKWDDDWFDGTTLNQQLWGQ